MTGQWHGGKGSRPRSMSVNRETYDNNWDRIFGKKRKLNKKLLTKYLKILQKKHYKQLNQKKTIND